MSAWFEDMAIGDRLELGSYLFTAEDIIRFARQFDPQPFHLSEEGAAATHFGRLCASGWHTGAVFMRLLVLTHQRLDEEARQRGDMPVPRGPSPGFENLKWLKPVYAGDTIRYASEVTGKIETTGRPDWGVILGVNEGINQHDDVVFRFDSKVYIPKRGVAG